MSSLFTVKGATPFYLAVFVNAFIDLGHKITIQNTVFKVHDGAQQVILIAIINALILLPYITLFSPIAGIANKNSKPRLMRYAAWFSLFLTILISVFYILGWFWPAMAMTFLMAVQSALYSPAKLSYIKPMFGVARLTEANGLAQAAVIAGILLGTLVFSLGFEAMYEMSSDKNAVVARVAPLGFALVALAILQLILVYRLPEKEDPETLVGMGTERQREDHYAQLVRNVFSDHRFLLPVLGLALFWSVGQGMLAAFPSFAKAHAGITNAAVIQAILASTAVGIAMGSWLAGKLSPTGINLQLITFGVAGLSIGLWSLPLWQGAWSYAVVYFAMGVASALFIVPLNAYIQWQAGAGNIGSVIAGSNLVQNIAMLSMLLLTISFALLQLDGLVLLCAIAAIASIGGTLVATRVKRLPTDTSAIPVAGQSMRGES